MVKRTADASTAGYGSHRSKRRRDTASDSSAEDYGSESEAGDNDNDESYGQVRADPTKEAVKQVGLNILRILGLAKSKEGRLIAALFHDKPPRQQYPDYYNLIKHPIALNDIKRKLQTGKYKTHDEVKADFDLCFNNAKTYNMEGSDIYSDAEMMQQLVAKEYRKLAPVPAKDEMQVDVEGEISPDDPKKAKEHSLHSLLKSRLKQLLEKTQDDTGRILSAMFQELPSKKAWASYYETIKQPIAFDSIRKRVKKKEYPSSAAFASDVELVFSNAMIFNSEDSQIYADAVALRDLFRQLMSDLPPPHTLSQYQKTGTKIKLKLNTLKSAPVPAQTPASAPPPPEPKPASPVVTSKVEEIPSDILSTPIVVQPRPASPKLPSTSSIQPRKTNATQPAASTSKLQQPATPAQPPRTRAAEAAATTGGVAQPSPQQPVYSHAASLRNLAAITATMPPAPVTPKATKAPPPPPPPPPTPHYHYLLKQATIETKPRGRSIPLSSSAGVTTWVIQLLGDEQNIVISDIDFVANEEEEESSDEENQDEDEEDGDAPSTNGKKKGSKARRGRGRPPKAAVKQVSKPKANSTKKKLRELGDVQVKLDGQLINEAKGEWNLAMNGTTHIIEVGEKEGMTWRVQVYRLS